MLPPFTLYLPTKFLEFSRRGVSFSGWRLKSSVFPPSSLPSDADAKIDYLLSCSLAFLLSDVRYSICLFPMWSMAFSTCFSFFAGLFRTPAFERLDASHVSPGMHSSRRKGATFEVTFAMH